MCPKILACKAETFDRCTEIAVAHIPSGCSHAHSFSNCLVRPWAPSPLRPRWAIGGRWAIGRQGDLLGKKWIKRFKLYIHSRSYRHGTIPLKHGNGAMTASNFGGSHGSMMTSIQLILPFLDAPPWLAWSSNPKNVFPNVMRLQNPTKISSICQDSRTFPIPFPFMFFSGFTSI